MNWYIGVLKKYADFKGRASRAEYWYFMLCTFLIGFALSLIGKSLGTDFLYGLYAFATFIPSIAVAARRLHDTGRSGWWQLVTLAPVVGVLILIIFLATKGDEGGNEYGEGLWRELQP